MELIVSLLESVEALALVRAEWDQLATAASRPFSAPVWVLACWAAFQPDGATMRVVEVRGDGDLVGVMPLFSVGGSYSPIGSELAAVEPLARPGLEEAVAGAAARALSELAESPAVIRMKLCDDGTDWAGLLTRAWPGRGAWARVEQSVPVPGIEIGDCGFEAWIDAKSSSFRRETRRKRKRLEEAGATFRFADEETLEHDVGEFLRLHRLRLSGQGGSSLDDDRVGPMLVSIGRELLPEDRFRLLCMEVEGKVVAAQVLLSAGAEESAWNSGFDEEYANLSPSMQCILEALRDASDQGKRTMSLGPGDQPYKDRLATGTTNLISHVLVPRGRGSARVRGEIFLRSARQAAGAYASSILSPSVRHLARSRRA